MVDDAPIFKPGDACGPYTIQRLICQGVPELYVAVPSHAAPSPTQNESDAAVFLQCADIRRNTGETPTEAQWSEALTKLSALRCPLVPKLLKAGVHNHQIRWTATKHVSGTLFPALGKGPSGRPIFSEILALGMLVASAMVAAEAAGVIHGNFNLRSFVVTKPSEDANATVNVLGLGSAELFGVPLEIARQSPLLRAPEQLLGQAIDARSDIYSLGMILHTLIARRVPFGDAENASPADVLALAINQMPPPLSEITRCPTMLSEVIACAIQKKPEERFPTWVYFATALSKAFHEVRADADLRFQDEKQKTARERAEDAEAHYVETHPAREGAQSGFRERTVADRVHVAENASDTVNSPPESPPPPTQKSAAEPLKEQPSPPTTNAPAPPSPPPSARPDPPVRRARNPWLAVLLAGAGLVGGAGVAVAMRALNARAEVAIASLGLSTLASRGALDAAEGFADAKREVPSLEEERPALSAQPSPRSARNGGAPVASGQAVVTFPMEQWEPSRRNLVRTVPPVARK